jgi:3-oxoacyl-[acyl-carrier protein] reductase
MPNHRNFLLMRQRFNQKHVLVTGGGRGLGFEIARQFGLEGARLSLLEYNSDLLAEAQEKLKQAAIEVTSYLADVSKRDEVERAVAAAEAIAPIDVLVNNAGIAQETPFLKIEEEEWRRILDINLTGSFFVAQTVCRHMARRQRGTVVNMSSKNGLDAEFGYAHYNASKAGVILLTKTMAVELAHLNIRVNAVCPGYLVTPMSMEIESPEFVRDFVERYIPANRPGNVADVAPLFLFLASEESRFITGQVFVIDGGQLAGQKPSAQLLEKAL